MSQWRARCITVYGTKRYHSLLLMANEASSPKWALHVFSIGAEIITLKPLNRAKWIPSIL